MKSGKGSIHLQNKRWCSIFFSDNNAGIRSKQTAGGGTSLGTPVLSAVF